MGRPAAEWHKMWYKLDSMPGEKFYWSRKWRATRAEHLQLYPFCAVCAAVGLRTEATDVDHVKAKELVEDPHDHENLRSLCKLHHGQKTIATEGAHRHQGRKFTVTGPDGWPIPYGDEDGY